MRNVLYVHYGDSWMRGSEICLLNLMQSLKDSEYCPILWTNNSELHYAAQQLSICSHLSEFGVLLGWQGQRASLAQYVYQVKRAKELIKQHDIRLIHANSGAPCQWMWRAARDCGVAMLTQLHSDYNLRDRLRLCLHLSPHIVAVSQAVSNKMLGEGYPKERLSVIHNGIDIPALEAHAPQLVRSRLGLPIESQIIASVGSLIPRKGMDRIIQVVASLADSHPDIHLVIIGDGPEHTALLQLAQRLDVTDKVHFIGEQHNVCGWLRGGVDLFVSGAREEAFGLVIAEAAVSGVPIVAPSVGGIPEVVEHQQSALLYDSDKPQQMAEHIVTLLDDPALANKLACNAKQRAHTYFSLQTNTSRVIELYNQLIEAHGKQTELPQLRSGLRPLRSLSHAHLMPKA